MNASARLAVAAVAVIAVGAIGLAVLRPGTSPVDAPAASPSAAPSPAPSPAASAAASGSPSPAPAPTGPYEAVFLRLDVVDQSPVVIVVGVNDEGHERQIARLKDAWLAYDIKSGAQGYIAPTGVVSPSGLLAIPSEFADQQVRWEIHDLHRPEAAPIPIPGTERHFELIRTEPYFLPNNRGGAFWGPGERLAIAMGLPTRVTFVEGRTGATRTVNLPANLIVVPQWTSDGSGVFVQPDVGSPPSGILHPDGTLVDETAGEPGPNCRTTGTQCQAPDGSMIVHGITGDVDRPMAALTAHETGTRFDIQGRFVGWLKEE